MRARAVLAATFALELIASAYAGAQDAKFSTEDAAIKHCAAGNVVWFNPYSRFYFESTSRFYGKTSRNGGGGFTCRETARRWGFQVNRTN